MDVIGRTKDRTCRSALVSIAALCGFCAEFATAQSGLFDGLKETTTGESLVEVRLLVESSAVRPGEKLWVGVEFVIEEGWHTYWRNPGDSGAPIDIQFDLPDGVRMGEILWPAPERYLYSDGSALDYVYTERVVLLAQMSVDDDAALPNDFIVRADVEYLVCKEVCIPGSAQVQKRCRVGKSNDSIVATDSAALHDALALLPAATGEKDDVASTWDGSTLVIEVPGAESIEFYPFEPNLPRPIDEIGEGAAAGERIRIRYPESIYGAGHLEGIARVRIRGENAVYIIEATAPAH